MKICMEGLNFFPSPMANRFTISIETFTLKGYIVLVANMIAIVLVKLLNLKGWMNVGYFFIERAEN